MTSDFNFVSALGPSAGPGAAASAPPCEAAPSDGTFAALVDNAATGGDGATDIAPDAGAGIDAGGDAIDLDAPGGPGTVADPLALSEWWRCGSALAGQRSTKTDEAAAVDGDESSDDDEAESGEVPLDGMMNLTWLLTQPAGLPRNISVQTGGDNSQADASAIDAASRNADGESLKGVNQPFAETWNRMSSLDATAQAPAPGQPNGTDVAEGTRQDVAPTVESLMGTAAEVTAEASATPDGAVALPKQPAAAPVRPKSATVTTETEALVAAQQRAAAAAIQANRAAAAQTDTAAADVANTPGTPTRLEPAAARLARSIERSGGATIEAAAVAPTMQPFQSLGEATQDGSSAFSSSSHEQAPPAPEPVRVGGGGTPVFVVPHSPSAITIAGMPAAVAESAAGQSAPLQDADMVRQFVQTMRVQFRDGIGDAVLRLRPEHLGEVSISLRVENGTVAATVNAEAAAVRQWLEANQASLRQSLSEQGLQLDRFVVQRDPEERQSREEQGSPRRQQQRRRGANGETPRFEITV